MSGISLLVVDFLHFLNFLDLFDLLLLFGLFLVGLFLIDGFLLISSGLLLLLSGSGGLLSLAFLVVFDGLLGSSAGLPEPNLVAAVEYPHGSIVSVAVVAAVVSLGHLLLEHLLQADGLLLPGGVGDVVTTHASAFQMANNNEVWLFAINLMHLRGCLPGQDDHFGLIVQENRWVVRFGGTGLQFGWKDQASLVVGDIVVALLDKSVDWDSQIDLFLCWKIKNN